MYPELLQFYTCWYFPSYRPFLFGPGTFDGEKVHFGQFKLMTCSFDADKFAKCENTDREKSECLPVNL